MLTWFDQLACQMQEALRSRICSGMHLDTAGQDARELSRDEGAIKIASMARSYKLVFRNSIGKFAYVFKQFAMDIFTFSTQRQTSYAPVGRVKLLPNPASALLGFT